MNVEFLDKKDMLRQLDLGDVVKCTNGKEYEFVRLKQKKFIGKNGGQLYDIPVQMFVEVVRKAEKPRFDPGILQEGELFYITDRKNDVSIYRFKYMINEGKIMAENPVTGGGVRVASSLAEGRVVDLMRKGAGNQTF